MDLQQAVNSLSNIVNLNEPKKSLNLTIRHGEAVSFLNGLIEVEVDLKQHSNRVLMKFKAPGFVKIFRVKKDTSNE
jgi:hypothetical protein